MLIVDDHEILRYGLRALFRGDAEIEVVAEAGSVAEAIDCLGRTVPDVVLMDVQLPDGSGIELCRDILSENPAIRVLFFSAFSDKKTVLMAILAGAHGHVSKDLDIQVLRDAIHKVSGGMPAFNEDARQRVREVIDASLSPRAENIAGLEPLSRQEERVMALVVQGKTNKEIGAALSLSEKTVKNYLHNAFQKFGVSRRAHAAALFDIENVPRAKK